MEEYVAYYIDDHGYPVSVIRMTAINRQEAADEFERQLMSNPSRMPYCRVWVNGGRCVATAKEQALRVELFANETQRREANDLNRELRHDVLALKRELAYSAKELARTNAIISATEKAVEGVLNNAVQLATDISGLQPRLWRVNPENN